VRPRARSSLSSGSGPDREGSRPPDFAAELERRYHEGVAKKVNLPLLAYDSAEPTEAKSTSTKKPSIEAARTRLGGRVVKEEGAPVGIAPGVAVSFAFGSRRRVGVVIFASRAEVHVLLDGIRLRRLPPEDVALHDGELSIDLERIAGDARLFGLLVEGQAVRYADDGGNLIDGKVVEKCRWGALVLRDSGSVVAVGFRKLWPKGGGDTGVA
jgi:hypothetical protein